MNWWNNLLALDWREPQLLWLCVVPFLILLLRSLCVRNRLDNYAERHLHRWVVLSQYSSLTQSLFSRTSAYVLGWILLVVAAAGPRLADSIAAEQASASHDVFVVVDISRSMRATDIEPDRLRRSRIELYEFLQQTQNARVGIIVYTASSHLLAPLTHDMSLLTAYLALLDKVPAPTYGSDHVKALSHAQTRLSGSTTPGAILWVTDGDIEMQYQQPLVELAGDLQKQDIPLFIFDVGSSEGDAIPLQDGKWLRVDSEDIVSRSQQALLKSLASQSNGAYSTVRDNASDWQALYTDGIRKRVRKTTPDEQAQTSWQEYYPYALLPAMLLLAIAWLPYPVPVQAGRLSAGITATVMIAGMLVLSTHVMADDALLRDAYQSLQTRQFADADKIYEQVSGYDGRFGQGVSIYRLGDYSGAINQFTQAALQADTDRQRAMALYNLGNAYFQTGNYKAAIRVYRDVLAYDAHFTPASKNLALSEELQKIVEIRLQQQKAKAARSGRGSRAQQSEENIAIDNNALASLDDVEDDNRQTQRLSELYETLLEKGIEYADLAAKSTDATDSYSRRQALNEAQLIMQALENRPELLWKRIFELEYGFAAPQDQPASVAGIKPW